MAVSRALWRFDADDGACFAEWRALLTVFGRRAVAAVCHQPAALFCFGKASLSVLSPGVHSRD